MHIDFSESWIDFLLHFLHFNLDFFQALILQKLLYAQLLLHFQADPFETLHMLLGWSEDMQIVFFRILKLFCYHFLLHF